MSLKATTEAMAQFAETVKPETVAATPQEAAADVVKTPDDPIWITTPEGAVCVYGHALVSPKDIKIIAHALNSPTVNEEGMSHNTRMIRFLDNGEPLNHEGDPVMGNADAMVGSIGINMVEIMEKAIEDMKENKYYSLLACWHHILHSVIQHEVYHNTMHHVLTKDTVALVAERDTEADEFAHAMLIELAKKTDIEPAPAHESEFFCMHAALAIDTLKDAELKERQQHQLDNHIMFTTASGKEINSFKQVMRVIAGAAADDPEWDAITNDSPDADMWIKGQAGNIAVPNTYASDVGVESYDEFSPDDDVTMTPGANGQYQAAPQFSQPMFATGQAGAAAPNQPAPQYQVPAQGGYQPGVPMSQQMTNPAQHVGQVDQNQLVGIIHGIFNKCRDMFFNGCGQLINSDLGFQNPDAVLHTPIQLTPEEAAVCVAMDTLDQNGRWCPGAPTNGMLRGKVMKNTKLPAYVLYLKIGDTIEKRMLMPQNPAKQTNTGRDARAGRKICYVYEGDQAKSDALKASGNWGNLYFKSVDGGAWTSCS